MSTSIERPISPQGESLPWPDERQTGDLQDVQLLPAPIETPTPPEAPKDSHNGRYVAGGMALAGLITGTAVFIATGESSNDGAAGSPHRTPTPGHTISSAPHPTNTVSPTQPSPTSIELPAIDPVDSFEKKAKAAVLKAAEHYGLTYQRTGYAEYPPQTGRYAEHYGFADGYFSLTPLEGRQLTQQDYAALAPVLIWNSLYVGTTLNFTPLYPQGENPGNSSGERNQLLEPDYDSGTFDTKPQVTLEQTSHSPNLAYVVTFSQVPIRVANMDKFGTTNLDGQIGFGPEFSGPYITIQLVFDSVTGHELHTELNITD